MGIEFAGYTVSPDYDASFGIPSADAVWALVTWFDSGPDVSLGPDWGDPLAQYALSSTVHVALFERDPGASGSSYSVTVDGTGTPFAQVVCVGYNGTDGEVPVVDPAKITGGSSDSNPTSYTLPALTVSVAGSINVVFSSSYSFPVDLPTGFNLIVQHSFEIVVAERAVSVGSTGTITLERDGGTQYAGPSAGLHFIVEPSSGGEPEPPDPLEVDPLSALRMGTNIVGLKSFAQVPAAFAFSKVGMSPNTLDSDLLGNPAFEVGTMTLQGGKSGAPSLTSFATELESRLPARPALRTWMESLGSVNLAIGSLGAGLSAPLPAPLPSPSVAARGDALFPLLSGSSALASGLALPAPLAPSHPSLRVAEEPLLPALGGSPSLAVSPAAQHSSSFGRPYLSLSASQLFGFTLGLPFLETGTLSVDPLIALPLGATLLAFSAPVNEPLLLGASKLQSVASAFSPQRFASSILSLAPRSNEALQLGRGFLPMQVAEALARSLGSSKLLVRADEQHALILGVPELERLSLDFAPLAAQGFGTSGLVVRPQQLAAFLFGAPEFVVTVLRSQAPTREDLAQVAREEQFAKVPFEEWLAKVRQ